MAIAPTLEKYLRPGYSRGRLRMRLLSLPTMPLLAFVVTLFVNCAASAQAEPQGAPQPDSIDAPSASSPSGGPSNQAGAQPEANPTVPQPESSPTGGQHARQDAGGEPQSGHSESGSTSEKPASKVLITIDKTRQQMTVLVDGIEQYKWPV